MREIFANRSYSLVLTTLAVWSVLVVAIFYEVTHWPYIGAQFNADTKGKTIEVASVASGSAADIAGVKVGDRYVAIEDVVGNRYQMTGFEAVYARHQITSFAFLRSVETAHQNIWNYISQTQFSLETSNGKIVTISPAPERPISALSIGYFVSMAQSLAMFMTFVGIWAFANRSFAVKLLVTSGFAFGLFTMSQMHVTARELVWSNGVFDLIYAIGPITGVVSIYSLVTFLWYFPSPVSRFPFAKLVVGRADFATHPAH